MAGHAERGNAPVPPAAPATPAQTPGVSAGAILGHSLPAEAMQKDKDPADLELSRPRHLQQTEPCSGGPSSGSSPGVLPGFLTNTSASTMK